MGQGTRTIRRHGYERDTLSPLAPSRRNSDAILKVGAAKCEREAKVEFTVHPTLPIQNRGFIALRSAQVEPTDSVVVVVVWLEETNQSRPDQLPLRATLVSPMTLREGERGRQSGRRRE